MSYSVCLSCKDMVSQYQKYCSECEKSYGQDELFWKRKRTVNYFQDEKARIRELNDDLYKINKPVITALKK